MRILVNIDELGPRHGVAVQTFQVSRELARRGHAVDVVYLRSGAFEPEYRAFADRVVRVPALSFGRRPLQAHRIFRSIVIGARLRPDVIYDNLLWSLPWSASVARLTRAGLLGNMHGFSASEPSAVTRFFILKTARRVICVSEHARAQLLAIGVDPATVEVVHNGIDPAAYPVGGRPELEAHRRALGLPLDAFVVVSLGRIDRMKGVETLLEAARLTSRDGLELVFAGAPVSEEYLAEARRLADGLRCHWLPSQADVVPLLHAADLVAVPSLFETESFGRVAIEGFATGRPVVASRTGGLVEVFTGDFERFLFPRGDSAALAAEIDALRDWRRDEPELAERCAEHVRRNFDVSAAVDRIEAELVAAARR